MSRINLRGRAWFMLGIYAGWLIVIVWNVAIRLVTGS